MNFPRPEGVRQAESLRWNIKRTDVRAVTAEEASTLSYHEGVLVLDTHTQDTHEGRVYSFNDGAVNVRLNRTQAIIGFDLDDPTYWGDNEDRERRPPMNEDGQFVIVREYTAAPKDELFNALKASAQIAELQAQVHRIANYTQGLPTLEQHEALLADVNCLREEVGSLIDQVRNVQALLAPKVA